MRLQRNMSSTNSSPCIMVNLSEPSVSPHYKLTMKSALVIHIILSQDDVEFETQIWVQRKSQISDAHLRLIDELVYYCSNCHFFFLYDNLFQDQDEFYFGLEHLAWNPYLQGNIDAIEAVQRRATKLIPGFSNLEYSERLKKLNVTTLIMPKS